MALPQTVRVKLSSEEAGSISITPVVAQELPVRDLIEHMLGVAGKDEPRIREILLRGTLVSGASRFRWAGWEADAGSLRELLATFPDPDPSLPFGAERCVRAILRGGRQAIEIPRETAARKPLFQRGSFWDVLMEVAASGTVYSGYSYRDRADRYIREFTLAETERLRAESGAVRYSTLREQLGSVGFVRAELYVVREAE
jgi:hypothetical protein